jgi:antitoxin MazE
MLVKARLVRIGNSRGVRLPKTLIEQAALGEEVELELRNDAILIKRTPTVRVGWAEAAAEAAARGDDELIGDDVTTRFDREEWKW